MPRCVLAAPLLSQSFSNISLECTCLLVLSPERVELHGHTPPVPGHSLTAPPSSAAGKHRDLESHFRSSLHQGQPLSFTKVVKAFCSFKPNNNHPIQTGSDFDIIAFFFFLSFITVLNYCSLQHQPRCKILRDKLYRVPPLPALLSVSISIPSLPGHCHPTSVFRSMWWPGVHLL